MDDPVNLTNLRSMIDGDKELEKVLFEEFYSSFEAGLNLLQVSCSDSAAEVWQRQVHALKGVALNLGAKQLGILCKNAQDAHLGSERLKAEMLSDIRAEYNEVKVFLQGPC